MRLLFLLSVLPGVTPLLRADPAAAAAAPAAPLALPGYELRTLEQPKRVLFQVGGSRVEVAVPIFVYCPIAGVPPVARLLQEAQAALLKLAAKPEWTADELRLVITSLEQAADLLNLPTLPGKPVAAPRD
jgi:hypothetical protein